MLFVDVLPEDAIEKGGAGRAADDLAIRDLANAGKCRVLGDVLIQAFGTFEQFIAERVDQKLSAVLRIVLRTTAKGNDITLVRTVLPREAQDVSVVALEHGRLKGLLLNLGAHGSHVAGGVLVLCGALW